jgi:hypothetical protein
MATGIFQPIIHFAPASLSFVGWFAALSSGAELRLACSHTPLASAGHVSRDEGILRSFYLI